MSEQKHPKTMTPLGRFLLGTAFGGPGIFAAMLATGVGPFEPEPSPAPLWVLLVASSLFVVVGLWFWTAATAVGPWVEKLVGPYVTIGLLSILHWVAFGPGVRECSGGFSLPFFSSSGPVSDFQCRLGFGAGAVFFDGLLSAMLLDHWAGKLEGRAKKVVKGVATGLVLIVLGPLLLVAAALSFVGEGWKRLRGAVAGSSAEGDSG